MSPFARWLLYPLIAIVLGFIIDLLVGDPDGLPHPVMLTGKLVSWLENLFRKLFPKSAGGEIAAGGVMFLLIALLSFCIPFGLLWLCYRLTPILGVAVEAIMCWQILATRALRDGCMKVFRSLKRGNTAKARYYVSRIVSRDTEQLGEPGILRASVESVAKNTCNASAAPLICLVIGGAPLGWLYRAVNTMDSMVGCVDEPYKHFGLIPARADDVFNFIPSRITALFMLLSGFILNFNVSNGWKIFKRDRYNHKSPNAGQTESVCAGLLGVQLGGNASYNGIVHMNKTIGDPIRQIELNDIKRSCSLLYNTAILSAILFIGLRLALFFALLPR